MKKFHINEIWLTKKGSFAKIKIIAEGYLVKADIYDDANLSILRVEESNCTDNWLIKKITKATYPEYYL